MPEILLHHVILGGVLIGIAVGLLLLGNGRIAGIGGSLAQTISRDPGVGGWRILFLAGIAAGGAIAAYLEPQYFDIDQLGRSPGWLMLSGLVMGFGSRMCNGCTSGHGICGIARLSPRSTLATVVFFSVALASTYLANHIFRIF